MASRGDQFDEGPRVCPFVALEFDRDKRADQPDYRHRCFAEPAPAPRAIAHQEAYCLSPNFPACPIFQDWASRAAARAVPVADGDAGQAEVDESAAAGESAAAAAAVPLAADLEPLAATDEPEAAVEQQPLDEPYPPDDAEPGADAADAEDLAYQPRAYAPPTYQRPGAAEDADSAPEQLGAFDAGGAEGEVPPVFDDEPAAPRAELPDEPDEPDVPAFLAGRELPRPRSSAQGAAFHEKVKREDVVPSWEIDSRYGAQASDSPPGDRFGGVITAIAVIAILAMGVAGVIFLPGLLAGGGPERTAAPSIAIASGLPTSQPSALSTPGVSEAPPTQAPTVGPPTATPTPEASPILYRIKAGDNLARIARRFDTTVEEILALNPQIENPNHIQVGQVIEIPAAAP